MILDSGDHYTRQKWSPWISGLPSPAHSNPAKRIQCGLIVFTMSLQNRSLHSKPSRNSQLGLIIHYIILLWPVPDFLSLLSFFLLQPRPPPNARTDRSDHVRRSAFRPLDAFRPRGDRTSICCPAMAPAGTFTSFYAVESMSDVKIKHARQQCICICNACRKCHIHAQKWLSFSPKQKS